MIVSEVSDFPCFRCLFLWLRHEWASQLYIIAFIHVVCYKTVFLLKSYPIQLETGFSFNNIHSSPLKGDKMSPLFQSKLLWHNGERVAYKEK